MVTLLLRTGEISEASFNNAFNNAFDFGRANIIKLFIQRRPMLLNLQAINGQTLLMEAIEYGHRNIVELLLSYGADTQLKDKNGLTALDYALRKDHKDIIRLLTQGLPNAQEEIKKAWSRIKKYEKREKEQHLKVQEELKRGYRH